MNVEFYNNDKYEQLNLFKEPTEFHEDEIWKDIGRYEGLYQVSNYGKVWSIRRQKFLSPCKNSNGYLYVSLTNMQGYSETKSVHRLVAETFIPKLDSIYSRLQVHHKDEVKTNNFVKNLEWLSSEQHAAITYTNRLDTVIKKYKGTPIVQYDARTKYVKVWKDAYQCPYSYIYILSSCGLLTISQTYEGYRWFFIDMFRRLFPNIDIKEY